MDGGVDGSGPSSPFVSRKEMVRCSQEGQVSFLRLCRGKGARQCSVKRRPAAVWVGGGLVLLARGQPRDGCVTGSGDRECALEPRPDFPGAEKLL